MERKAKDCRWEGGREGVEVITKLCDLGFSSPGSTSWAAPPAQGQVSFGHKTLPQHPLELRASSPDQILSVLVSLNNKEVVENRIRKLIPSRKYLQH